MRLRVVLPSVLAFFALTAVQLAAQEASVDYMEGTASQRIAASWSALSVGDTIPLDGSVKLEEHSLVQLKAGGATITLSQPGTYAIRKLLAARASLPAAGTAQALAFAFWRVVRGSKERLDEAGGIRAEKMPPGEGDVAPTGASTPEDVTEQSSIEKGKWQINSGEYQDAIDSLLEAVEKSSPGETSEARYYLATAYSLSGDTRRALGALSGAAPSGTEEWAPDFILLRAKLLVDTFAFADAAALLTKAGPMLARDEERAPTYFFLLALAYRGTGDIARQSLCLDKVIALAAETDLGVTAAELRRLP